MVSSQKQHFTFPVVLYQAAFDGQHFKNNELIFHLNNLQTSLAEKLEFL